MPIDDLATPGMEGGRRHLFRLRADDGIGHIVGIDLTSSARFA